MTVVQSLIDLQEVDGRIRELEHELKDLPRRKALESARMNAVSADLTAAKGNLEYIDSRASAFEDDANALREKIQQLKVVQATLSGNREYQQYSVQIDLLTHDLETTTNNWVAVRDDRPAAEKRIEDAQAAFDAAKSAVDATCAELDERIAVAQAELAEALSERNVRLAQVTDKRAGLYYERLRTKRWPVIVPLTQSGVCDGCHLQQPPSVSQMVDANQKNGEEGRPQNIVSCTMCGRMLYRD